MNIQITTESQLVCEFDLDLLHFLPQLATMLQMLTWHNFNFGNGSFPLYSCGGVFLTMLALYQLEGKSSYSCTARTNCVRSQGHAEYTKTCGGCEEVFFFSLHSVSYVEWDDRTCP
jgi:hypothetical protein